MDGAKLKSRDYPYDGESATKVKCKCSGGIVILSGAYGEYKRNLPAQRGRENPRGEWNWQGLFSCLIKRMLDTCIYIADLYVSKNLDLSSMEYISNILSF